MVERKTNFNTKGFTLVELIIVITILAILATIAFISFSSFTSEARDVKVKSELSNIRNSIEATSAKGVSLMSFVKDESKRESNISIGGRNSGITLEQYNAGTINGNLLEGVDELPHFVGSTTLAGGAFQLMGELSEGEYIIGNYKSRDTRSFSGTLNGNKFTITDNRGLGFFKVGDSLNGGVEVLSISSDLSTLTLSGGSFPPVGEIIPNLTLSLATGESSSLFSGAVGTIAMCQTIDEEGNPEEPVPYNGSYCMCDFGLSWVATDINGNSTDPDATASEYGRCQSPV